MAIKYNDLYMDLRRRLREAGAEDATQAARELVCTASGKTKNELLRDGLLYASPEVERSAYSLCARHLAGEPVAYLIGEWEFYGLGLDISPAVLIPRPDTEVLVQTVVHELDSGADCRVLDLCAGSGCIGLAVASQLLRSRVLLGEWDEEALKICRQNIRRNQLSARVTSLRIDAREKPSRQLGERASRARLCAGSSRLTAARTDWISTASSRINGATLSCRTDSWPSRSASGRRTRCCASCARTASATSRSSRTCTVSPAWSTDGFAKRSDKKF